MHWKTTKPCSYYLTFLHFDHVLGITLGHGSEEDEGDVLHQQQELTTASDEVSKHLVMKAGMKKDTFSHWIMINLYEYSLPFEQGAPSTSWARSRPSSRRRARRRRWSTGRARRRAPPPSASSRRRRQRSTGRARRRSAPPPSASSRRRRRRSTGRARRRSAPPPSVSSFAARGCWNGWKPRLLGKKVN